MNDLEFLVRYVPEWPNGATYVRLDRDGEVCFLGRCADDCDFYPANSDEAKSCFNEVGGGVNTGPHYSESQWLSERARLQNKPKWDSHTWPSIFQCESGNWFGVRDGWNLKDHITKGWKGDYVSLLSEDGEYLSSGKILGDWRDTLERRPERESYVTKAEADQYYCDREGECLMNNPHQHASSTEWTGPEQGFPPPGTRCMVMDDGEWLETYIIGMDTDGFCVYETPWSDYDNYDSDNDPQAFYPLTLTDEVNRLEEALSSISLGRSSVRGIAQHLVAAGCRITSD